MSDDLIGRLEKTAGLGGVFKGVGTYLKNVTNTGVRQAQKKLDNVSTLPTQANQTTRDLFKKDLHNAKVDRNIAVAGTAGAATLGGGALGGYSAYQKSKEPVVTDIMEQNQVTQQPKIASEEGLMERLEKTAGVMKYLGDVTGINAEKAKKAYSKAKDAIQPEDLGNGAQRWDYGKAGNQLRDWVKADRDKAKARKATKNGAVGAAIGTGAAAIAGGGYAMGKKNEEKTASDLDLMERLEKTAGVVVEKPKADLMERLEKTANDAFGQAAYGQNADYQNHLKDQQITQMIIDLHDKDPQYLEHALQNAGLMDRAVENGVFRDLTPGEGLGYGSAAGGVMGGLTGLAQGAIIGAGEGAPFKGAGIGALAGAGIGAGIGGAIGGIEGLYRKNHPSDLHLKYYGGQGEQGAQPEQPVSPAGEEGAQPTAPDIQPAHEENPRQGAGSVSHAPAGSDKTASEDDELMKRLEKTASGEEDKKEEEKKEDAPEKKEEAEKKDEKADGEKKDEKKDDKKESSFPASLANLTKTAAAIPGYSSLANLGGKVKNFVGNASGANAKAAHNEVGKFWSNPESAKLSVGDFSNKVQKLETNAAKADKATASAQKSLKVGGGLAAAGAGTAGVAKTVENKNEEKTASEVEPEVIEKVATEEDDTLTGLFKEAAAAIIEEKLPPVRQHVDPMSRIKF